MNQNCKALIISTALFACSGAFATSIVHDDVELKKVRTGACQVNNQSLFGRFFALFNQGRFSTGVNYDAHRESIRKLNLFNATREWRDLRPVKCHFLATGLEGTQHAEIGSENTAYLTLLAEHDAQKEKNLSLLEKISQLQKVQATLIDPESSDYRTLCSEHESQRDEIASLREEIAQLQVARDTLIDPEGSDYQTLLSSHRDNAINVLNMRDELERKKSESESYAADVDNLLECTNFLLSQLGAASASTPSEALYTVALMKNEKVSEYNRLQKDVESLLRIYKITDNYQMRLFINNEIIATQLKMNEIATS